GRQGALVLPREFAIRESSREQLDELFATMHVDWADEHTFRRGDTGDSGWCQAELLRVRALRALAEGRERDGEGLLRQSLDRARVDGALSWELRTTTSLARLRLGQERAADAIAMLRSILERFTEGRCTADVREAQALLDMQMSRR